MRYTLFLLLVCFLTGCSTASQDAQMEQQQQERINDTGCSNVGDADPTCLDPVVPQTY